MPFVPELPLVVDQYKRTKPNRNFLLLRTLMSIAKIVITKYIIFWSMPVLFSILTLAQVREGAGPDNEVQKRIYKLGGSVKIMT